MTTAQQTATGQPDDRYTFTPDMGEISGFGGDYEDACRAMVRAGLLFWDDQPERFDPHYKGMQNVYGICIDDNDDARALDKAILAAVDGDCTGAMHQAAIEHILAIRRHGWGWYVTEMRKPDEQDNDA